MISFTDWWFVPALNGVTFTLVGSLRRRRATGGG